MSVTFSAAPLMTAGWVLTCGCPDATQRAPRFGAYDDAVDTWRKATVQPRAALDGCSWPDHCPYNPLLVVGLDADGDVPFVDVCDGAADLLGFLGLRPTDPEDMAGEVDAEAFLGRVLVALACAPADAGRVGSAGRFIDCGRAPGQLNARLGDLHALAQWCSAHRRAVQWG